MHPWRNQTRAQYRLHSLTSMFLSLWKSGCGRHWRKRLLGRMRMRPRLLMVVRRWTSQADVCTCLILRPRHSFFVMNTVTPICHSSSYAGLTNRKFRISHVTKPIRELRNVHYQETGLVTPVSIANILSILG